MLVRGKCRLRNGQGKPTISLRLHLRSSHFFETQYCQELCSFLLTYSPESAGGSRHNARLLPCNVGRHLQERQYRLGCPLSRMVLLLHKRQS